MTTLPATRAIAHDLAMAAAHSFADRRMVKAGREQWDEGDWHAAVDEFQRLWNIHRSGHPNWDLKTSIEPSQPKRAQEN